MTDEQADRIALALEMIAIQLEKLTEEVKAKNIKEESPIPFAPSYPVCPSPIYPTWPNPWTTTCGSLYSGTVSKVD